MGFTRKLLFLCLLINLLVGAVLAQNLDYKVTYTLKSNSYKIINIANNSLISMEGFYTCGPPGKPMLPHKIWDIVLPNNCNLSTVEIKIVNRTGYYLKGEYNIPPAPPIVPRNEIASFCYCISSVYNTDALYPNKPVRIVHRGQLRDAKLVGIEFTPIQYNPIRKKLYINEKVTIEIMYKSKLKLKSYSKSSKSICVSDYTYKLLRNLNVLNLDKVNTYARTYSTEHDYVIVTTNYIKNHSKMLCKFVEFLKARGFNPLVITENDYGYAKGQQRAINIRNWLKTHYLLYGIKYVLLIGNPDPDDPLNSSDSYGDVPMMMTYPIEEYGYVMKAPTDYFYADLTGNWDSNGNGIYGEPWDNVDIYPEVFVGRIPVYNDNITQLDMILSKIMEYGSTYGNWRKRVMLPMAIANYKDENDEFLLNRTDGRELPKYLVNNVLKPYGFSWFVMYETQGINPVPKTAPYFNASLNRTTLINEWNKGFGVIFWSAHGSRHAAWRKYWAIDDGNGIPEDHDHSTIKIYKWLNPYTFQDGEIIWSKLIQTSDTKNLTNNKPAIVFQGSCYNGYPEISDNLGYSLLKRGAIATVSSSRVSWYRAGIWYPTIYADDLDIGYEFVKGVIKGEPVGEALYMAKASLIADSEKFMMNLMDFNLYGDPSTTIYDKANKPPVANFTYSPKLPTTGETVTLNASQSYDPDGSIIKYVWNFGDGNTTVTTKSIIHHVYSLPGEYNVTLTVIDNTGLATSTSKVITVLEKTQSTVTLHPQTWTITPNSTAILNVTLDRVPSTGFSYASVTVNITNSSVMEITRIAFPSWASLHTNTTLPALNLTFTEGDLSNEVTAGQTNVTLATLTIKALKPGITKITLKVNSFQDDSYKEINSSVAAIPLYLTVMAGPPPIDGHTPKDLNHDGLYEDVNGDGVFNFGDIVFFFYHLPEIMKNPAYVKYLDFNKDGTVNFGDVVALFQMLSGY